MSFKHALLIHFIVIIFLIIITYFHVFKKNKILEIYSTSKSIIRKRSYENISDKKLEDFIFEIKPFDKNFQRKALALLNEIAKKLKINPDVFTHNKKLNEVIDCKFSDLNLNLNNNIDLDKFVQIFTPLFFKILKKNLDILKTDNNNYKILNTDEKSSINLIMNMNTTEFLYFIIPVIK